MAQENRICILHKQLHYCKPSQVATCTLLGNALTWWNSHVKTVSHEAAYGMTWKTLKKMMTDKYSPRGEIKKLEIKLWNLKNVARAYSAGPSEKKEYAGTLPLCNKCKFHHNGPCTVKSRWFDSMAQENRICILHKQLHYCKPSQVATCTLLGNALTWWNSHVKTVSHEAAYGMTWKTLKKMMTDKYSPRGEIKKLEIKLWNLKVKGTDVVSYTQRFQELALMCGRMFPKEYGEIKKYVGRLPNMIQGSVMASKLKTMQDAINDNNAQQPHFKRQNVARAYSAGPSEKKEYAGTLPLCNKCKFHHNGPCTVKCANCNRVDHLTRDCRSPTAIDNNDKEKPIKTPTTWKMISILKEKIFSPGLVDSKLKLS
nr:hypothetical protein [Tanacetum cinerariifolium]